MEVSKIGQHRQRRDLRDVIELVSQYRVITSRVIIANHEVQGLLDELVGPSSRPINEMDYLDWGVARAFGKVGGFRIKDSETDEDVTESAAAKHANGPEAFYRKLAWAELELNRKTLEGPTSDEEPAFRSVGVVVRQTTDRVNRFPPFSPASPDRRRPPPLAMDPLNMRRTCDMLRACR